MTVTPRGIQEIEVADKRVFVRVDFNVPVDENQEIVDDTRIRAALPTIQHLMDQGARIILASHFGRPKGEFKEKYSLRRVAQRLEELLGKKIFMASDCVGEEPKRLISQLKPGEIVLLENLRFYSGEEANDPAFARQLAELADIYVNDAFGAAHRAHASTAGMAAFLPAAAGFLMQKEVKALSEVLTYPKRPFLAIIGGAKVSDKIKLLDNFLDKVDMLAVGGGMANTFFKAQGWEVGKSLVENDYLDFARHLMASAPEKGVEFLLPVDVVVADRMAAEAQTKIVKPEAVPADWMILDIGPATVQLLEEVCQESRTVLWNGPMGVFELPPFAQGTTAVARILARTEAVTIIGGGDSAAAVEQAGVAEQITHISTGGGASLEFLEGRELPGVVALAAK
ncbi:MAG: phosphoglycerate kinase [Syntrophomonadaceae bacterium]|nr:phosphoglycerate kinase [Syntrophomonadaceae bacterium]